MSVEELLAFLNEAWPLVLVVLGFLGWLGKVWIKQEVDSLSSHLSEKVEKATAPIQVGANGGWSLPDAIRLLKKLDEKTDSIQKDLSTVSTKLAKLEGRFEQHVEEGE